MQRIDKNRVNKILFITLSNIGDIVLTLPALGVLKREFPSADITVIVSPGGKELFEAEPSVSKIIIYNKHTPILKKIELALSMRELKFDLVVDLRNSMFPLLIGAKYNTSLIRMADERLHRSQKHLKVLAGAGISIENAPFQITFSREDKLSINSLFSKFGILPDDNLVAIAPGAKSHIKRWHVTGFIKLCNRLIKEAQAKILLIGDDNDRPIASDIVGVGASEVYNLCGRTNIRELAYLLSLCKLLVSNDSAPVHIAGSVGLPTVAIFGPTDDKKYGPLSPNSKVIRKNLACSPCEKAWCNAHLDCMREIYDDEVFKACKEILSKA